jgi:hypothetical protein
LLTRKSSMSGSLTPKMVFGLILRKSTALPGVQIRMGASANLWESPDEKRFWAIAFDGEYTKNKP